MSLSAVAKMCCESFDFVRDVFQSCGVFVDHFADVPKNVLNFRFIFERQEAELEHRKSFFFTLNGVVEMFEQVLRRQFLRKITHLFDDIVFVRPAFLRHP